MSAPVRQPERNVNLHAPWRAEYIRSLEDDPPGCFLCRARDEVRRAPDNLLVWKTPRCLAVLNRFPYTGGHLLVAPCAHVAALSDLPDATLSEMMQLARDAAGVLGEALKAEGFNIGLNLGRCAGAGLPDHLHLHVVPRWGGDTNFMSVLGDVRILSHSLRDLRARLLRTGRRMRLPANLYARRRDQ